MSSKPKACLVIGASRGLGAALVERALALGFERVIGVARTGRHTGDGRYQHVEIDIASAGAPGPLGTVLADLPDGPLLVIYNAAIVQSDLRADGTVDFSIFEVVNRVGVTGFGNVLRALEAPLLARGGLLVGISSFAALAPPVREPRVAYAASKAYLDSALRSLRYVWKGRVKVVTVHLGQIGGPDGGLIQRWLRPSYAAVAARILDALMRPSVPREINLTLPYTLVYRWLVPLMPETIYFWLFERLLSRRPR